MIKVENLTKEYENVTPLKDVSVTINDGDVVAIIGPSGTGKSTFLRCLNLLETPTAGRIFYNDVEITARGADVSSVRMKMGMVFQSFNLFPHLTVIENIMMPQMDLLGRSKQEAFDKAMILLKSVGLTEKALSYPDKLSGGQKQRIAIARTLAMDCETILFDEPTSALDPAMVGEVQAVIRELSKTGKTIVIVTHEMKFAKEISSRVFFMEDGGIYEQGTPEEIFDKPKGEKTRRFINRLSCLDLTVCSDRDDILSMMTAMQDFCSRHQVGGKKVKALRHCFDEMCREVLLRRVKMSGPISFKVEYAEEPDDLVLTISYGGPRYNPSEDEDAMISLSIVNHFIKETTFSYENDLNTIHLVID